MQTATTGEQDDLLTVPEVAKALRLDETTVGKLCRDGELGAFRAGRGRGRWRIPSDRVQAYKAERTPSAASELHPNITATSSPALPEPVVLAERADKGIVHAA